MPIVIFIIDIIVTDVLIKTILDPKSAISDKNGPTFGFVCKT
jgi:hypothetical protein